MRVERPHIVVGLAVLVVRGALLRRDVHRQRPGLDIVRDLDRVRVGGPGEPEAALEAAGHAVVGLLAADHEAAPNHFDAQGLVGILLRRAVGLAGVHRVLVAWERGVEREVALLRVDAEAPVGHARHPGPPGRLEALQEPLHFALHLRDGVLPVEDVAAPEGAPHHPLEEEGQLRGLFHAEVDADPGSHVQHHRPAQEDAPGQRGARPRAGLHAAQELEDVPAAGRGSGGGEEECSQGRSCPCPCCHRRADPGR
mmetsp:Transcript_23429/g.65586  ORF Transcript_23429/g.65586 Transcript_23429/m.65586 type:complete len:254 (+) Transcript_23429:751-1512(+)